MVFQSGGPVNPDAGGQALTETTIPRSSSRSSSVPSYISASRSDPDEIIGGFTRPDPRFNYDLKVYEANYRFTDPPIAQGSTSEHSNGKYIEFSYYESDRAHPSEPIYIEITIS